ncbi:hypothetical protein L1987_02334 [Smallanthus sonchifolius]|uniref:Uncharacterized protein n=1 Tax=Smallanthus sonchifolius TaxID=185202 RepID=A0ACB9K7K4_9ASTR|nr:hypothetical protein L1987_02334 [Smallanthus sonchifolius]
MEDMHLFSTRDGAEYSAISPKIVSGLCDWEEEAIDFGPCDQFETAQERDKQRLYDYPDQGNYKDHVGSNESEEGSDGRGMFVLAYENDIFIPLET